jgi:adenylosuccinate synthase
MGAVVIVDAMWGDSGKGKVCAHLSVRENATLAVRAGVGTNAGASLTLDDGTLVKARQLPTGWVNPTTKVAVGSGVLVETVGSTCTGNGAARADFVLRRARQARDEPTLAPYVTDVARAVNSAARDGVVLVEGSQGTLLSLALSADYPCTTSDNCTAVAAMDDVGLNWRLVSDVIMVVKALPTRVGEGPLPYELSAGEARRRGVQEHGVITSRPRRKASQIDWELLEYATMLNGPTKIALTFCDHADPRMRGGRDRTDVTPAVQALVEQVEAVTCAPVVLLDTGPRLSDMIDLERAPDAVRG